MKNNILQRVSVALNALNNITVSGKQNLANLSGSIAILEELYGTLNESDIKPIEDPPKNVD